MKNLTKAQRKKAMKSFKPGDVITWGEGEPIWSHRVVEVTERGLVIDVTACAPSDQYIDVWAKRQPDGRYLMTVLYDKNMQGAGPQCRFQEHGVVAGPPRLSTDPPDIRMCRR